MKSDPPHISEGEIIFSIYQIDKGRQILRTLGFYEFYIEIISVYFCFQGQTIGTWTTQLALNLMVFRNSER